MILYSGLFCGVPGCGTTGHAECFVVLLFALHSIKYYLYIIDIYDRLSYIQRITLVYGVFNGNMPFSRVLVSLSKNVKHYVTCSSETRIWS